MGVAHAPVAALLGCDSGAEGRPAAQSAAGRGGLRTCRLPRTWRLRTSAKGASADVTAQARPPAQSGERCSRVSVPPTCSPSEATKVRATREGEADE
jgi:hypothetical protein